MNSGVLDVAQIRLDNAMLLFDEFVRAAVKHPDAATLRGLERRFAERLQIQPSYWSQIKGRSRQIGERLARQFEVLCHKPVGWMDQRHVANKADTTAAVPEPPHAAPQDDDERFIVGLVLTYYRRHPQRARARLLDLLGEVLTPAPQPASLPSGPAGRSAPDQGRAPGGVPRGDPGADPSGDPSGDLWERTRSGVAPLKRKR